MREILLTKGQVALVDDEDYDRLNRHKWSAQFSNNTGSFYAIRTLPRSISGKRQRIYMHREVMLAAAHERVDHINHDTLNQQRSNLRICTTGQNGANRQIQVNNTSGYKGVDWHKRHGKWRTQVQVNGKSVHIGVYNSPVDAALAYDRAAIEYNGEFALTNKMMGLLP